MKNNHQKFPILKSLANNCSVFGVKIEMPFLKSIILLCSILLINAKVSYGQAFTGTYPFTSVTTTSGLTDPTTVPTATGVTFGSFSATGYSGNANAAGRFSFTGNPLAGNAPTSSGNATCVCNGTINTGFYYQVTVTVATGYTASLTGITFDVQRSGTGIRQYAVRSNADSYAANLTASINPANVNLSVASDIFLINDATTTASVGSTITLSGANFTNLAAGTSRTFRFYGWNAEAAAGSFGIDNVVISGTATSTASASITPSGNLTGLTYVSGSGPSTATPM